MTDKNLMQYLGILEQRAYEIIQARPATLYIRHPWRWILRSAATVCGTFRCVMIMGGSLHEDVLDGAVMLWKELPAGGVAK